MAGQIETSKVVPYVVTGSDGDEASASKVVAYLILKPGGAASGSTSQGHVHCQIVRRG